MAGDSTGPTQPGKIAQSGSIFDGQNPIRSSNHLTLFLVQMIIIISLARLLGVFLRKIHQPRVIAEVIGGILLGPSVFGRIPGFTDVIFPAESIGYLKLVAEIGLILFLFLVGLELDPSMLVANAKQSAFISIAGMTVPFGLGVAASSALYNYLMPQPSTVPFSSFFLFLGVAMSITAFPVLARILTEKKILKSRVGMTTISAAAVDDFASWCFLGLVISIINATNGINALYTFLLVIAYAAILILGVRKILLFLIRWSSSSESLSEVMVFVTFALIFVSAFVTEVIGVHAIFGAFLVGVIIPHGDGFALKLTEKIEDIVTIVFLPLYFASSGLKTNVGLIDSPLMAGMVFLVIFVACAGKILGCLTASKLSGLNWRESLAVGILLNTKGLVELIVLNLGLDAGVINDKVFVIMVLMALVTTFMTSPLISWIYPIHLINKDREKFSSSFELSKISSIGEGADPTSPETEPCLAEDLRALVCLETMDSVPTLMHLVQIFQYYRHFYPDRPLTVHALRLMELSERTSAVMKAAESSATLKFDPIINVFKTFGGLNSIDVNPILSVSTVQDFGENIVSYAELYNVNFILLPWLFSDSLGLDQFFDSASGRRKQHRDMVSYVLKNSNVSVGVLVDRGFTAFAEPSKMSQVEDPENATLPTIFMPYIGGEDDREALLILLRLAAGRQYRVVICRIKYGPVEAKMSVYDTSDPRPNDNLGPPISSSPATKGQKRMSGGFFSGVRQRKKSSNSNTDSKSTSTTAASPPLDPVIAEEPLSLSIDQHSVTSSSPTANPDDRALQYFKEQSKKFPTLVIEEFESPDPPALALTRSLQFGKTDLIVVGKSHPIINLFNSIGFNQSAIQNGNSFNGTSASFTIDGRHSQTAPRPIAMKNLDSSSNSITNPGTGATSPTKPVYDLFQNQTISGETSTAKKLLSLLPSSSVPNMRNMPETKDGENNSQINVTVTDAGSQPPTTHNTMQKGTWEQLYNDEKFVLGWLGGLMRRRKVTASLLVIGKCGGSTVASGAPPSLNRSGNQKEGS